jgi:hypothetical protein
LDAEGDEGNEEDYAESSREEPRGHGVGFVVGRASHRSRAYHTGAGAGAGAGAELTLSKRGLSPFLQHDDMFRLGS